MRSAIVEETTNIVTNICVAVPVDPSPFAGYFMVGLVDPTYDDQGNELTPGTLCEIGWIYDLATGTFSAP